jgi:hypothetical protein
MSDAPVWKVISRRKKLPKWMQRKHITDAMMITRGGETRHVVKKDGRWWGVDPRDPKGETRVEYKIGGDS